MSYWQPGHGWQTLTDSRPLFASTQAEPRTTACWWSTPTTSRFGAALWLIAEEYASLHPAYHSRAQIHTHTFTQTHSFARNLVYSTSQATPPSQRHTTHACCLHPRTPPPPSRRTPPSSVSTKAVFATPAPSSHTPHHLPSTHPPHLRHVHQHVFAVVAHGRRTPPSSVSSTPPPWPPSPWPACACPSACPWASTAHGCRRRWWPSSCPAGPPPPPLQRLEVARGTHLG